MSEAWLVGIAAGAVLAFVLAADPEWWLQAAVVTPLAVLCCWVAGRGPGDGDDDDDDDDLDGTDIYTPATGEPVGVRTGADELDGD